MSRLRARRDTTHLPIRRALEAVGLLVLDVAGVANLGADLIVIHLPTKTLRLLECKTGSLAPSKRKLTDSEASLLLRAPTVYRVVGSVDEALQVARELAA